MDPLGRNDDPSERGKSRWIGRIIREKWRIDSRISRGGVGTVYAATHRKNGSRVAIKILHPQFSRDNDTRSRFMQEGYAANQVNHAGVVRILDDDVTEEGYAYLVMELLEGELLEARRIRKGGTLPLREVYEVADQLLDVLAAAHDKGIVHRDIKPDNLFVTNEGRLKVLDFGFAQMKRGVRTEQTATGYLLGTPGFMSPEQAVGNNARVDAQTDIWAVGATLFNLISGCPVHDGESAAEMLVAAANYQPRSLANVTSGLPLKLIQIVDRAIAFDKADRWPNARAMHAALKKVSGLTTGNMFESGRRSIPDHVPESIELLDENDVEEAQPSWIRPVYEGYDDGPTISVSTALSRHARFSESPDPLGDTVRVDDLVAPPAAARPKPLPTPAPFTPLGAPAPLASGSPLSFAPSAAELQTMSTGPMAAQPADSGNTRAWLLLIVGALSMIVVILVGLFLFGLD
ncbi:Serine/threonine protein kinase [Labilithrix luteola]|uniref:Serine/threonine protein kinase n=1 Tax=Labilithrix luteola TaxID=1391654 RepID=A0A0K1Q0P4_9BACT|nr:serine/threonine-protein kinase [Labilithrix luteola]AKU98984.1 Serine/threonine protein kinase [Labilithrix luteola]